MKPNLTWSHSSACQPSWVLAWRISLSSGRGLWQRGRAGQPHESEVLSVAQPGLAQGWKRQVVLSHGAEQRTQFESVESSLQTPKESQTYLEPGSSVWADKMQAFKLFACDVALPTQVKMNSRSAKRYKMKTGGLLVTSYTTESEAGARFTPDNALPSQTKGKVLGEVAWPLSARHQAEPSFSLSQSARCSARPRSQP